MVSSPPDGVFAFQDSGVSWVASDATASGRTANFPLKTNFAFLDTQVRSVPLTHVNQDGKVLSARSGPEHSRDGESHAAVRCRIGLDAFQIALNPHLVALAS